jgi:hypothetical protein
MNRFFSFFKQRTNMKKIVPSRQPIVRKPVVRSSIVRRPASSFQRSFQRNLIERLKNPASCGCGK